MNLGTILSDLYRRFDYTGSPLASSITTRLTAFVNESHRELLTIPGCEKLRDDTTAITAYASIARTGLPPTISRIHGITDRANQVKLREVPLSVIREIDPGQSNTGSYPYRYAIVSNQAVYRQPGGSTPAASGLWVASSAAGDTTQKAYVESVVTGGQPAQPIAAGTALNGVTRVAIGALTTHLEVTKFWVDAVGVGSISLYDAAAAGNELARIPIGLTYSRYEAVEWFPIQTTDTTEYVDYERTIFDLLNATDEPLLPPDFHRLMVIGARMKEYEYLDDATRFLSSQVLYEQGKTQLRDFVMNSGDRIASLRPTRSAWSRLGGNYPADGILRA